jgi:LPXTG-motif cell wall-anchored protein
VEFENTTTTAGQSVNGEELVQASPTQVRTQVKGVQLARTGDETRQMVFVAGLALLLGGAAIFGSDKLASAKR